MKSKIRQSQQSGTMPPKSSGKSSTQNPLTQLVLVMCSTTLQDRLTLDIVTAWVQFLGSWYSFSWWRELLWYGKKKPYSVYCVYTYPSFCSSLGVLPKLQNFLARFILIPSSPTVWNTVGRRWCGGWEENYLQSLGLSHLWKKNPFLAFHPSLATYSSNTCCQECFTLFSTVILSYTFNHLAKSGR